MRSKVRAMLKPAYKERLRENPGNEEQRAFLKLEAFFASETHALRPFPRALARLSLLLSSVTTHSHQARAAEAAPRVRNHPRLKRRNIGRAALEARPVPSARSTDQLRAEREATVATDEAEHKRKRTPAALCVGTRRLPVVFKAWVARREKEVDRAGQMPFT